jgi:hypothetical protein
MYWNTLGVAQYRTGCKAARVDGEVDGAAQGGGDSFDWFFLAMCHQQQGDEKTVREWYDRAVTWMDKNDPINAELRGFRKEAAEVLRVTKKNSSDP